jgi:hypothetical protein
LYLDIKTTTTTTTTTTKQQQHQKKEIQKQKNTKTHRKLRLHFIHLLKENICCCFCNPTLGGI